MATNSPCLDFERDILENLGPLARRSKALADVFDFEKKHDSGGFELCLDHAHQPVEEKTDDANGKNAENDVRIA